MNPILTVLSLDCPRSNAIIFWHGNEVTASTDDYFRVTSLSIGCYDIRQWPNVTVDEDSTILLKLYILDRHR